MQFVSARYPGPLDPPTCFSSHCPSGKLSASLFPMAAALPLSAPTQVGGWGGCLTPMALLQSGARAGSKVKQAEGGLMMLQNV